jgi:phage-related protein
VTSYINLNSIPVAVDTTVKRYNRAQRVQFGDGYSQVMTDGLNSQVEVWSCLTGPLSASDAYGIESYLLRQKGQAIQWVAPNSSKTFAAQFQGGLLDLGYSNLDSLVLTGYTRPTNYTANLATGLLTSVNIPNLTDITVALTLAARSYVFEDGWEFQFISSEYHRLSFTLRQVYV